MRILVLNHEHPPVGGGGGVFARDLSEEWAKLGNLVTVITSQAEGLVKKEKVRGVSIHRIWAGWRKNFTKASLCNLLMFILIGFFRSFFFLRKKKPDIVIAHFALPAGLVGYLLKFFFQVKFGLVIHGADIYDPSRLMSGHRFWITRRVIGLIIDKADFVVASTQEIKKKALTFFQFSKEIKVIPLGIKIQEDFKEKSKKFLVERKNKQKKWLRLITVGRLIKRKNLALLLSVTKRLFNEGIFFELRIIGDGEERQFLEKRVITEINCLYPSQSLIKFCGKVSEEKKQDELIRADLFISTALHEGFGLVFLEAMQAGLPILCSDNGGQVFFLQKKRNAYFFCNNSSKSLWRVLKKCLQKRENLLELGKNNYKDVQMFSIEKIAREYLGLF